MVLFWKNHWLLSIFEKTFNIFRRIRRVKNEKTICFLNVFWNSLHFWCKVRTCLGRAPHPPPKGGSIIKKVKNICSDCLISVGFSFSASHAEYHELRSHRRMAAPRWEEWMCRNAARLGDQDALKLTARTDMAFRALRITKRHKKLKLFDFRIRLWSQINSFLD